MTLVSRLTQGLQPYTMPTSLSAQRPAAAPQQGPGDRLALRGGAPAARPVKGVASEEARQLQADLRLLGFFTYPTNTGYFGEITEAALTEFQTANSLTPTGAADDTTLLAIKQAVVGRRARNGGEVLMSLGATGEQVRQLQADLRRLGVFTYPTDTAYYGTVTEGAVKAFQVSHQLPNTGKVDERTQRAIRDAVASQPVPVSGANSAIAVDPKIQPRSHSTIPGYQDDVEQCGEFVYRYFKSQGKDYPTLGQPYTFLTTGKDQAGATKPQFERTMNGSATPPHAGDILVAKGPRPGQFHTALITKVEGDQVHVLQSNVPYNWQGGKEVEASFKLEFKDGRYTMPALPTSQKGYRDDYPVTGWIHPTGKDALPPA